MAQVTFLKYRMSFGKHQGSFPSLPMALLFAAATTNEIIISGIFASTKNFFALNGNFEDKCMYKHSLFFGLIKNYVIKKENYNLSFPFRGTRGFIPLQAPLSPGDFDNFPTQNLQT